MKKNLWMLVIFAAAFYLLPVLFRPLLSPEEFRSAEVAREMLAKGDWVTPELLGVRYFSQTPLSYWTTALSFKLFGENNFALRLIPLLSTLLSAFLLGWFCRKRNCSFETALSGVFLYLSALPVIFFGAFGSSDSLFALLTTLLWGCTFAGIESTPFKERMLFLAGAGAALGCAFLTKGFAVFILFGGVVLPFLLWEKRWKELWLILIPPVLSLAVIAPWGVAIHKAEPDFWHYFLQHVSFHYCSGISSVFLPLPLWLLPVLFFAGIVPGIIPVLTGISKLRPDAWRELSRAPEVRFSLCALVLPLLFLSGFENQAPGAILVCFAPAALLGSLLLDKMDTVKGIPALRKLTTGTALVFIILGTLFLAVVIFYLLWGAGFIPTLPLKAALWAPFLTTLALGTIISGTIFFIYRKAQLPEPGAYFSIYAGAMLIAVCFFPGFTASSKMPEYELLDIASKLSAEKISRPRLITSPDLMYPVSWCFKDSTVRVIDSPGELEHGHKYAVARGEAPLALSSKEINKCLSDPKRKEGILIIMRRKDNRNFIEKASHGKHLAPTGELSAFYYPPQPRQRSNR